MNCINCNEEIPAGRLKAVPHTKTCTKCSNTEAVAGFMTWDHKTAPVINICSQETLKKIQELNENRPPLK